MKKLSAISLQLSDKLSVQKRLSREAGTVPIIVMVAIIGVLGFFAVTYLGDSKSPIFQASPKPMSHASEEMDMKGQGLIGRYFNTSDFSGESFTRTDPEINFNWSKTSPDPKITSNTFSARWLGLIIPVYSENYTIYAKSSGGVRVSVNDKIIIDKLSNTAPNEFSGEINFQAKAGYPIIIEYTGGKGNLQISWSSKSMPKEIIPQKNFFTGSDDVISSL